MTTRIATDAGTGLGGFVDSLAQSFIVDRALYLTKIDVYFSDKSSDYPVELSLRTLENGVPSRKIIPNSVVTLSPSNVNISSNAYTATTFTFAEPIYVTSGIYSFVLTSDTKKYRVYVSEKGNVDLITNAVIGSKDPTGGVLFKTQNGVSWEMDNSKDIKYKVYRANFTSTSATIDLKLKKGLQNSLTYKLLPKDPFTSYASSPVVKVKHPNHGFANGAKVKFFNLTGDLEVLANANAIVRYNGILYQNIVPSTYLTVANAKYDSYTVLLTIPAGDLADIKFGSFGGATVTATSQHPYSVTYPAISKIEPTGTSITYRAKTTDTGYNISGFEVVNGTNTNTYNGEKIIVDDENTLLSLSSQDSFAYRLNLSTTDSYLSPKIDLSLSSINFITNDINNPSSTDNLSLDIKTIASANTLISFASTGVVTIGGGATQANVKTMQQGAFIEISGASQSANNGTFRLVNVATDGTTFTIPAASTEPNGSPITLKYFPSYVAEEASTGGTAKAKYITRKIELANPSTAIVTRLNISKPASADVKVYFKTQSIGEESIIDSKEFTELSLGTLPTSSTGEYTEIEKVLDNLSEFTAIIFKIVLISTSRAEAPKVKDLRIIALE